MTRRRTQDYFAPLRKAFPERSITDEDVAAVRDALDRLRREVRDEEAGMTDKTTAWTDEERAEMAAQRERDNAEAYEFKLRPVVDGLDTPAARLEVVRHLMTPGVDEQTGEEVPAVITPDQALALLEAPLIGEGGDAWEIRARDMLADPLRIPRKP